MTASPPGPPGPQFEPPASSTPGSPPAGSDAAAAGPFSAPASGPQFSAPAGGPQYSDQGGQDPAGAPHYGTGDLQPPAGAPQWGGGSQYPGGAQYPAPGAPYAGAPTPAGPPAPATGYQNVPPPGGYPGAPDAGYQPVPAQRPERIGLGLGAAAVVVLVCCALTAAIYHWGFIASITAWLMAVGASWAYRKVGGEPVKGRVPLLVLIVVGIVLGFLSMVASAVWDYYWEEMGSAGTTGDAVRLILDNLFNGELWRELGSDALFYFLFAALGAFGVIRRMSGAGKARV